MTESAAKNYNPADAEMCTLASIIAYTNLTQVPKNSGKYVDLETTFHDLAHQDIDGMNGLEKLIRDSHAVGDDEKQILDVKNKILAYNWSNWKVTTFESEDKAGQAMVFQHTNEKTGAPDTIIKAYRGTNCLKDWVMNTDVAEVPLTPDNEDIKTHEGFHKISDKLFGKVENEVGRLLALNPDAKVLGAGHSLGGALASIDAAKTQNKLDALYTIGQPAAGNSAFADFLDQKLEGKYFRFVNGEDIVTKVLRPPFYKQAGIEINISDDGQFSLEKHRMPLLERLKMIMEEAKKVAEELMHFRLNPSELIARLVTDHSPAEYLDAAVQNLGYNPLAIVQPAMAIAHGRTPQEQPQQHASAKQKVPEQGHAPGATDHFKLPSPSMADFRSQVDTLAAGV